MFSHCAVAQAAGLRPLTANTHGWFEVLVGFLAGRAVRLSHVGIFLQMLHIFESFTTDAV
jgi:hypothetical protein